MIFQPAGYMLIYIFFLLADKDQIGWPAHFTGSYLDIIVSDINRLPIILSPAEVLPGRVSLPGRKSQAGLAGCFDYPWLQEKEFSASGGAASL